MISQFSGHAPLEDQHIHRYFGLKGAASAAIRATATLTRPLDLKSARRDVPNHSPSCHDRSKLIWLAWGDPVISSPETQSAQSPRSETIEIANGRELVIFFEKLPANRQNAVKSELPLLSVLRDTFGDDDPTIDRLRRQFGHSPTVPPPVSWPRTSERPHLSVFS